MSSKVQNATLLGSLASAILASICCIGPVVFAILGIGGAGFLAKFEQYRPLFIVITIGLLGIAFYLTYKKKPVEECTPGSFCANPKSSTINKIVLWIAVILITFFIFFPSISSKLLN